MLTVLTGCGDHTPKLVERDGKILRKVVLQTDWYAQPEHGGFYHAWINGFYEDAGLDVKWGLTRNLVLDLTYNTDFAEVEIDDQQVNLTRFSLFFPKKRDFFLENAGIFEYGLPQRDARSPLLMKVFFSRRIGLDEVR